MPSTTDIRRIRRQVLGYFRARQRDLPWRSCRDPYAIWVSEIMLQQTRVATVIPYFEAWMKRFPDIATLANAELDEVLAKWSGLGYYSRARNLHRGAREVVERYGGEVPDNTKELATLPGIGRYTAGAIASQAFGKSVPVVDGNVARVLSRMFTVDADIKSSAGQRELWRLAAELVPQRSPGEFNQGLMELGATVCTPRSPRCEQCPLRPHCQAQASGTTQDYPVTRKRPRAADKPEIRNLALWIWRRGRVMLAHRRPGGLFGGLWELPQAPQLPELGDAIGYDLELDGARPLLQHSQELSHRMLNLSVWRATARQRRRTLPEASPYDRIAWRSLPVTGEYGLSSATKRILETAEKEQKWKEPKRRLRSSKLASKRS